LQADYAAEFEREQGFAEADWLRCLPGAVRGAAIDLSTPGQARVPVGAGTLKLRWQVLPPRCIGLARFARLAVHYRFDGVTDAERQAFMKYFDLYTQRGGG
jgi:hypothetical protein